MANKTLKIVGRIVDSKTKTGAAGLRVEAWDKDLRVKEVIGSAVTDAKGSFQIEFEEAPFRKLFLNRKPLLSFKVFRGDQLAPSTEAPVLWDGDKPDSEVIIKVNIEPLKPLDKTFTVGGEVRRADGSVFQDGFVQALITIQGKERLLGETKPDAKGRFEIPYTLDASLVSQLANGRMIARVLDSQRIQLAESLFIPFIPLAVNFTIPNPPPPPVKTLSVQGQVRRQEGGPIAKAIVRAFITTPEKEILLGEATTDSAGNYAITSDQPFRQAANAGLQARVFDKQEKILAASSSPIKEGVTTIDLVVPLQPPDEPSNVRGQVRQANGKPLEIGTVRIFGVIPGPEQLLGETAITKNDEGRYRIKYQPGAFSPKLGDATRIVIRVFDNQNQLLVSSAPLRAEADAVVDLTMSGNVAEPFVVRGQVTRSGAGGFANGVVRIFGMSGAQEKKLAPDAITDDAGRYEISYEAGEFNPTVNPGARVIVRVFDRQEKVMVSSEPFNAQPVKVIDLVIPPPIEEKPFIVRGQVLKSDGAFFAGVAVRAFHEAATSLTLLGEDTTNGEGRYTISYSQKKVTAPINLRVQVQDGSGKLLVQSELIAGAKREETVNLTIPIAEKVNVVKGQVAHPDGKPFVKAIVQAHDRDLRSEQLLGRTVTDTTGHYEISYISSQFARAEKESADLLVRAYKDERAIAAAEVIASSPIIFNAKGIETVDLVVGNAEFRGPSEYEQIERALRPLLEGVPPAPNVPVATLTDEDINFLAGETGLDLQHISFFAAAAKLGKETGLAPEIFYGFAREKLPTTLNLLLAENAETQRRALEAAISENIIPASVRSIIDNVLVELARRIGVVPELKLDDLAGILTLDAGVMQKLKEKNLAIEDVGEATLAAMVSEKIISPVQKKEIQLTVGLAQISGENLALTKALKTVVRESPVELVRWNQADWLKLLQEQKIKLPPGETDVTAYAENLRDVVEQSFPSEYFLHRVVNGDARGKIGGLVPAIAPLFASNTTIIPTDAGESPNYDWKGISEENKKTIQSRLAELTPLVNAYRSLGVAEILNQRDMNAAQRQSVIEKRFASLGTFYNNNPVIDLQYADFSTSNSETKKDQWSWQGIDAAEQPYVKRQIAATQRVFTLAGNYETADLLVKKGFDSACAITSMTEDDFLVRSGIGWEKGKAVYVRANEMAVASAHYYEAIRDVARGEFRNIALNNQSPSLVNDLKEIDGYEELFGNQNYCDCEACKSILSPAAYFVDLMFFVNENVSKKLFIPSRTNHPLYLKNRRPDLWTLKLSCHNTNTEIPYLQVVNEVLEKYLVQAIPSTDVYESLRTSNLSCRQPFNLALEETRLFLSHFDLSLAEIYKTLKQPKAAQYREQLLLSVEELQIISTVDPPGVQKRFGDIALADLDVQEFIRLAGISRSELDDLLATKFAPAMAQVKVKMVKLGTDIQQYNERLTGLTGANLDVIHRYLRLWKKTSWTLREFDLILSAMKAKGLLSYLEELDNGQPKILQLAQIKTLQQQLGRTPEEMATIIYRLPQTALRDNSLPLYNRIFDLEKIFEVASIDANGVRTYKSTATLPLDKANDKKTPLIIAGLGITESELQSLFKWLGLDAPIDQTIDIDIDVLSLLYRHAAIARGLKLGIEDFLHLVSLFLSVAPTLKLSQIETLVEATEWLKASPFNVSELLLIIKGEKSSSLQFTNDIQAVSAAVIDIQTGAVTDKKDKKDLLQAYLQRIFNLTKDQLENEFFPKLLSLNLLDPLITQAVDAAFTNGKPVDPAHLNGLLTLMHELERYTLLFEKAEFDAGMISFMLTNPAVFGIADLKNPGVQGIANMVRYRALLKDKDEQREALNLVLQHIQVAGQFPPADIATLAEAWKQPANLIASVAGSLTFSLPALEAISYLQDGLSRCLMLGIQGDALAKLKHSDKDGLLAARDIVVGAFASKYADEKTRNEKLEPYNDKLNTLKRDALCDYIISRSASLKFKDRNDLYNFFLLDVEMSGCFRTSYLVAAITSLQLYVHRCLINLEQSSSTLNPGIPDVKVWPGWIPGDEWEWRKNYRVWEANRKVFLYPENYIDPTLRDNKTEIFKELEDELLQQKISKESAEAAYKKYLSQFGELTRLRFAGGYYHRVSNGMGFLDLDAGINVHNATDARINAFENQASQPTYYFVSGISLDTESEDSLFYLFARTNVHPYRYSYRTYNHYKQVWTSWKSIDLGIEAAEISTIIYRGKLYIYWTEVQCKEMNKIVGGASTSDGYMFKAYVKYSFLDENGKWSAPQRLYIGQNYVDEVTLFSRVWKGIFPTDSSFRDKAHDSTVEKFQELVFRKPYATVVSDIKQPIALQHIWSHNKFESKVRYTTGDITYHLGPWVLNAPSQTFVVTNDDFDPAVVSTSATSTFTIFNAQVFPTTATVRLTDSAHCHVHFDFPGFSFVAPVSSQHDESSQTVTTNATNVSLSRNAVTNLNQGDMLDGAADISSVPSLHREFNKAFSENETIGYYIESGKESLTNHFVSQTPENDATLLVENGSKLDHVSLSTILTDELSDILFAKGLEELLSLTTQNLTDDHGQHFDFRGAYGEYYWELFFHMPFLIADHLNANQKFKDAKWWYERIFDPTAGEKPDDLKKTDHNWQFREFRGLNIQKLKDTLTDSKAIEAYKKDPFNPHAIARLRLSAYQKTIVMHYIDNLLDWGDYLFTQDTRESINEAEMLYQLAFDILGKRPIKVGKCETADENKLTYALIEPQIGKGSEFLIQLENYHLVQKQTYAYEKNLAQVSKNIESITAKKFNGQKSFAEIARKSAFTSIAKMTEPIPGVGSNQAVPQEQTDPYAGRVKSYKETTAKKLDMRENLTQWTDSTQYIFESGSNSRFKTTSHFRTPGYDLVKQYSMVFCVPPNDDLMKYWDRVEDRLFKIRNCMNIKGIRRSLSLFQPPIDPMLLVRARAAGLSLEDIASMVSGAGKLPAYRFTYLVEKAKQFTQTLQSFGSSLLSAMEKKDGEELTLLRSVHEKNILKLTRNIKRKQLQDAQYQYKASEAALANVQNRVDYYQGLIDTGLIPWEVTEQVSKWTASGLHITEATLRFLSSAFGFLPQIGSPFSMKYGGKELHDGTSSLAAATGELATIADNVAILAGLEASHKRREQEWGHQLKLAQQELKQSSIQLLAAEIRQQIAEQDLTIHDKNMEQADELFDFYKNKFTSLGLYNYMASTLNRLYRNAYNIAYDLAKQAEAAYQHEFYSSEIYIEADNWQFDRAGLLSGERLMLQLQQLEKKFMDENVRQPEITQTFSLAMLSPLELLKLRQTGKCDIKIPGIAFEVLYPGQFRRTIKSVRITIPCVAGPYTNISAKLTLTKSSTEMGAGIAPVDWPLRPLPGPASISSSTANNDAGVFELNFRDERYLPFEGAGAISEWQLELPASIRSFSYDTISDVLLHISYTACESDNRQAAETALATLVTAYAADPGFYRLVSLRYDFPDTLRKLFSDSNQTASFELTPAHFPYLLSSKTLTIVDCKVYVKPKPNKAAVVPTPGQVKINSVAVLWTDLANDIPTLAADPAKVDRIKGGAVTLSGSPVRIWTINAGAGGIDKDTTEDVLILLKYKTL